VQIAWQDSSQEVALFIFFAPVSAATHMKGFGKGAGGSDPLVRKRPATLSAVYESDKLDDLGPGRHIDEVFANRAYRSVRAQAQL
jgi:hypothetical protein